jgi:dTDP-4-dehydrorhamnose reductase
MRLLLLGSTGMLGQAIYSEAQKRNYNVIGLAQEHADICMNISDDFLLKKVFLDKLPDIVINTIAIIGHDECERNPGQAYLINSRPSSILADSCASTGAYYVYISTDHYYTGDKDRPHNETYPAKLVNEYSRSKYVGECFALLNPHALVVRTNIIGFRHKEGQPSFLEWVVKSIESNEPITLFEDYYTSSISVSQFSYYLFELIKKRPNGIINLACSDVRNKKELIEAIAKKMGYSISKAKSGKVKDIAGVQRAESLGLDVTKAESLLQCKLPDFECVVSNLVEKINIGKYYEI